MFRAEWIKIAGNRWVTSFLIWIFPVGAFILFTLLSIAVLLSDTLRQETVASGIDPWNTTVLGAWAIVNNEFGRWIILAFTAFVFAGEYQHGTWKNLTPRRSRVALIIAKFVTLAVFIVCAFVAMTIIVGVGGWVVSRIAHIGYGEVNGDIVRDFAGDYGLQMFISISAIFIAAGYAAVGAMFTRNILASVIVGIIINIAETGILLLLVLFELVFNRRIYDVYLFTPGYNLANISAWVNNKEGYLVNLNEDNILGPHSLELSLLIIAAWVVGLIAFTAWRFQRQDITS
jgi:hypothetical protein